MDHRALAEMLGNYGEFVASEILFASAICYQSSKLTDPGRTHRFISSAVGFLRRINVLS
jgi:hypothetical protein